MKCSTKSALLVLLMSIFSSNAYCAMINFQVSGQINEYDPLNEFEIIANGNIDAYGSFDSKHLKGSGIEQIALGENTGNSLTLIIGSMQFTEILDTNYSSGLPSISFIDGNFQGINYATAFNSQSYLQSYGFDVSGRDDFNNYISATWEQASYSVVPLPAAFWMFGAGIAGLLGLLRRRKIINL